MDSEDSGARQLIDDWLSNPGSFERYERCVRAKLDELRAATLARLGAYKECVEQLRLEATTLGAAHVVLELDDILRELAWQISSRDSSRDTVGGAALSSMPSSVEVMAPEVAVDSAVVPQEVPEDLAEPAPALPETVKAPETADIEELKAEATRLAMLLEREKSQDLTRSGELDATVRFRHKALLCSVRSLLEKYRQLGVEPLPALLDTRDSVNFLLAVNGGIDGCPACDDQLVLNPLDWAAFADAYTELAEAQSAFQELIHVLGDGNFLDEEKALLRSISAKQQLFYRLANRFERSDLDQQKLYHHVKQLGEAQSYFLSELNPATSDKDLKNESKDLGPRLERLRTERDYRGKVALKDAAKRYLIEVAGEMNANPNPEPLLLEKFVHSVREALRLKIPPTILELKGIFEEYGHLLPDEKIFLPCRRLVKPREVDIEPPEEPGDGAEPDVSEDELQRMLEALRPFTKELKFLILGGHPGDGEKRDKLQAALELKELEWPETRKNTAGRRFEGKIKQANRLLLDTRMIGHKVSDPAIAIAIRYSIPVTLLPKGSGFQQIVCALHEHLVEKVVKH